MLFFLVKVAKPLKVSYRYSVGFFKKVICTKHKQSAMEVPSGPYLKAILTPPDSILILGGCCMTLEYPHENKNQNNNHKKQQPKAKQTNKNP